MMALNAQIARVGLNQSQAAKLFGVRQSRAPDRVRGKIDQFSLDA